MNIQNEEDTTGCIAIIGMAARLPGAESVAKFWNNLVAGIESVIVAESKDKKRIKAAGILENIEYFDAAYFGYSPREAEMMDPQQRLMLECAVTALEDAGYSPDKYSGRIGVYLGSAMSTYLIFNLLSRTDLINTLGTIQISNGNDSIATTLSYKLNLSGPSMDLATTCSSSLVAVHKGCRSLLGYESDMVLAGGSSINVLQADGYVYQEGSILSPDGHCRPFDNEAKGTVEGSGVGLVVLKRLEDAIADNDNILAIIKGSAINNDGADKMGYTAPSVSGQANVIYDALQISNVHPDSISYVETHGTGTALGDPIEIDALSRAYRATTARSGYCAIGSVKANIGHLNTASGIAGLIKTTLALKYKIIPQSLNFQQPNRQINFPKSPFFVNEKTRPWVSERLPRRAAVSSFGMGGTNAHVIMQESPEIHLDFDTHHYQLLPISTKSERAQTAARVALGDYLEENAEVNLANISYTLQMGRTEHRYRSFVVVNTISDAVQKLKSLHNKYAFNGIVKADKTEVVFMFPGQGSQYVNMSVDLYQNAPTFKSFFDDCCDILLPYLNFDLRTLLFPSANDISSSSRLLDQTEITQPALFAIEYSLAKYLMCLGIQPQAMIGHSVGEYVAACLAGVMKLDDALRLITIRGKLISHLPAGKMLAVPLQEYQLATIDLLGCDIAAVNAENACVVSGKEENILALQLRMHKQGVDAKILHTSHAFHSKMLDSILEEFVTCFEQIHLSVPQFPYVSNLTGTWITGEQACDPIYWAKHLRHAVKFHEGIKTLHAANPDYILLEVGPGQTLSNLSRSIVPITINTLPHPKQAISSELSCLEAIGKLWLHGVKIDWSQLHANKSGCRVSLPTYPFQREYYWIDRHIKHNNEFAFKQEMEKWFYLPTWKKCQLIRSKQDVINVQWLTDSQTKLMHSEISYLVCQLSTFSPGTKYYELLSIIKAVINLQTSKPVRFLVVTQQANQVMDHELVDPENAMIQGLLMSFSQEYPHVKCCQLDFANQDLSFDTIHRYVMNEFAHDLPQPLVAIRYQSRWIPHVEPLTLEQTRHPILKENGVYLITGGLGHLGLIIANELASAYKARLVLIGRTKFPPENEWESYCNKHDDLVSRKIKKLQKIKKDGGEILVLSADVSNQLSFDQALQVATFHFSEINGLIHAAGDVGETSSRLISDLSITDCKQQFSPKIKGLKVLQTVMENYTFDFCCLFSSISSQLGGLGHAAYSSANIYMDASVYSKKCNKTPLITLNWDAWYHGEEQFNELPMNNQSAAELAITPIEGAAAFIKIMQFGSYKQIIISTTDLLRRIKQRDRSKNYKLIATHHRPELTNDYLAPRDDIELKLVNLWQDLLGINQIGIHDNFFELGGHSLLAAQLTSRVREEFAVEFNLQSLFKSPTVMTMASEIFSKKTENIDDALLEKMLAELNQ